ncbi:MAG: hypothetical protein K0M60_10380 [Hydrogenophaga sp.]|nr:hypothetical protein [Hydrogenophaga sp.]
MIEIRCSHPGHMHCFGNIVDAAQVEGDRALCMIERDHLVDKGHEMVLEHREGTGIEVALSIDRHGVLLVSNKERRRSIGMPCKKCQSLEDPIVALRSNAVVEVFAELTILRQKASHKT